MTGRAEVQVGEQLIPLQSPLSPTSPFSFSLKRTWQCQVGAHEVVIEKVRPLVFAAFRPSAFTVLVDGRAVAEKSGR